MTTVLHVEDDADVSDAVKNAFESLGFRGTFLVAGSLDQMRRMLEDPKQGAPDLVISDMELPDGSGLDVVDSIRAVPTWARVPIVIVSADTEGAHVDRAYALGANAYISKGTRRRSISEVFSALYAHWLQDARLPGHASATRTGRYVASAMDLRRRRAALYMQVGERLGPAHGGFWMDLALREGNLANLLAFLLGRLDGRELPDHLLDEAESLQDRELDDLEELEQFPIYTQEEALDLLRYVVSTIHAELADQMMAYMFPAVPVAIATLRAVAAATVEELATWIQTHSADPELLGRVGRLHADAEQLRT